MHPIADVAATLGGRFNLMFDAHDACVYQSAYGEFREQRLELVVGVREPGGRLWTLPFSSQGEAFPYVEQSSTLTTIAYRGVHPDLPWK